MSEQTLLLLTEVHKIWISADRSRLLWCHPGKADGTMACGREPRHCEMHAWLTENPAEANRSTWYVRSFRPLTLIDWCLGCGSCDSHLYVIDNTPYVVTDRGIRDNAMTARYLSAATVWRAMHREYR